MMKVFEGHPDVVMVYGDMLAVDENGQAINTLKYRQLSLQDLLCFQIIGQPGVFFRRSALARAGLLDTTYHYLLDHHLWIRLAGQGIILHVDQTWAAARYHAGAKNRAKAAEFGREAIRILEWVKSQPGLAESVSGVERRARASAFRVDARYLLDGGQPPSALRSWMQALFIHPPTALARFNIFVSALLDLTGLNSLRTAILRRRSKQLKDRQFMKNRWLFLAVGAVMIFIAVGCMGGSTTPSVLTPTPRPLLTLTPQADVEVIPKSDRPNILLILLDDLDAELDSMEYMPMLQELLVDQGLTIENYYISSSVCCPSRSTILRGQYTHNHGVLSNNPPFGGFQKFYYQENESSTLATWLQAAGYETVLLGKYLNIAVSLE